MSKPPKIDRKALKTPDEFVKSGQRILNVLMGQSNRFIPVLVAAVVMVLGVYVYDWWSEVKLEKAWATYNTALKADEKERWDKLANAYPSIQGTRPGEFAAVTLADHYFDEAKKELLKEPDKAPPSAAKSEDWYSKAMSYSALLPSEKQLLQLNRGQALELEKKYDDAMKEFEGAQTAVGEAKGLVQLSIGRIWELKGDKNKAIEVYEKISQDYASSEYGKMAKNHLRRLKGVLLQGS